MTPALLKRKEVFKVRIFLCFVAILFAISMMVGCKKDSTVTPVKNYSIIKLAPVDSTNLNGGKNTPPPPKQ
ncbi:hypothetical protein [Mucilaginibacter sp.]|uniref:hypothetical protein n=1 Tax=Mucilaginibacter sp. TaxID=1882438 RepID=UPI00374D7013